MSSLQYLNANINDLTISESFLDSSSEFSGINNSAIKVLKQKAHKLSNFNRTYFKPLTPINFQNTPPDSDNDEDNSGGYDKVDNAWYAPEKKTGASK